MIAPSAPLRSEIVAVEAGPSKATILRLEIERESGREAIAMLLSPEDSLTLGEAIVLVREGRVRRVTAKRGSARKDRQP